MTVKRSAVTVRYSIEKEGMKMRSGRKNTIKVSKTDIPAASLIRQFLPADYADSFRVAAGRAVSASPDDLMVGFWLDMPGWVNVLFRVRNFLVRFIGLKGAEEGGAAELEKCIRSGGSYGFAEIPAKDSAETVMLMRDKHLDAWLSVRKEDSCTVFCSTLVRFHNTTGHMYFFFIRPFHTIIVRRILGRAVGKSVADADR